MIEFENELEDNIPFEIDFELLESIASIYTQKNIELILCDNASIQEINKTYRNKNTATDVLSFPVEAYPHSPLGSIMISVDFVHLGAVNLGHTPVQEFTLLFIHGILHLLGYDHEIDSGQMREKEEELIKKFNLPLSLIVRNDG